MQESTVLSGIFTSIRSTLSNIFGWNVGYNDQQRKRLKMNEMNAHHQLWIVISIFIVILFFEKTGLFCMSYCYRGGFRFCLNRLRIIVFPGRNHQVYIFINWFLYSFFFILFSFNFLHYMQNYIGYWLLIIDNTALILKVTTNPFTIKYLRKEKRILEKVVLFLIDSLYKSSDYLLMNGPTFYLLAPQSSWEIVEVQELLVFLHAKWLHLKDRVAPSS